jgi:hypothetical protein
MNAHPKQPVKYIAVCIPCIDKPHMVFSKALASVFYMLGVNRIPAITIHHSGSAIHKTRNALIDLVTQIEQDKKIEIEWVMMLDSDMDFPPDVVTRLLMHNKDIVGCTYVRRSAPFDCLGKMLSGKPEDVKGKKLVEMAGLPTGCLLVKRSVFKQIKRPYFFFPWTEETELGANDDQSYGEDYAFCAKARAAGFKIWLDVELSKQIGHVSEKTLYPERDSWEPQLPVTTGAANG